MISKKAIGTRMNNVVAKKKKKVRILTSIISFQLFTKATTLHIAINY